MKMEILVIYLMSIMIMACDVGKENTDKLIEDIKKNTSINIESLPKLKEYIPGKYNATKDPFESLSNVDMPLVNINLPINKSQIKRPDSDRPKEYLENYALDTLNMVGILQNKDDVWALIIDRAGILHKVKKGNYLGQNSGKIKNIKEDRVEIEEMILDDQGGWMTRNASIKIKDQKNH